MREFTDSTESRADGDELKRRLDRDGYLFFRGLLDRSSVLRVRHDVLAALDACGWLAPGSDIDDGIPSAKATREEAEPDPEYFNGYRAVQSVQSFHELAHHPAMVTCLSALVGEQLLVHPRKILRAGLPRDYEFTTPAHQDYRLIQGTLDVLTAWLPLGDCDGQLGGLALYEGSHRMGVLDVRPVPGVGGLQAVGVFDTNAPECVSTDYRAGDVLLFHSLTVHAAKPNHTGALRLSVDYRYQSAREPVVAGSLLPHYFPEVPDHDVLTEGWSDTSSIAAPDGLELIELWDAYRPGVEAPPSRLVNLLGG